MNRIIIFRFPMHHKMIRFCILATTLFGLAFGIFPFNIPQKRLLDLTHDFQNGMIHNPVMEKFSIEVLQNGTVQGDYWLQYERYSSGIHVGTHMDAPCHVIKGAWSVNEIPINRLISPAAVINVEKKAEINPDYQVTVKDLRQWERQNGMILNNLILLIRTGWSKRWGDKERFTGTSSDDTSKFRYPGIHPDAAQWLANERNIIGVGTEAYSPDYGKATKDVVHHILLGKNIYFLENVNNIYMLPSFVDKLYVFPMKIFKASGAPVRILAEFRQ